MVLLSLGFYEILWGRAMRPPGRKQEVGRGEKQEAGDPASPYKRAAVAHFLRCAVVCRGYQIGLRERRDVSFLLMIVKGIHGEEDLTRYRLIVTLVTVTDVYTLATRLPMNP